MTPTQPTKKLTVARLSVCQCPIRRRWGAGEGTHRTFLGLMIRHQRVQMAPVAVRAAFWVSESVSAGRQKSETPARTRAHWGVLGFLVRDGRDVRFGG
jgi:hypothetical protein